MGRGVTINLSAREQTEAEQSSSSGASFTVVNSHSLLPQELFWGMALPLPDTGAEAYGRGVTLGRGPSRPGGEGLPKSSTLSHRWVGPRSWGNLSWNSEGSTGRTANRKARAPCHRRH